MSTGYSFFIILLLLLRGPDHSLIISLEDKSLAEEYSIYNSLIEQRYIDNDVELVVVSDQTDTGIFYGKSELRRFVTRYIPGLSKDVVDDYLSKNNRPHSLHPLFSLKVKYALISEGEIKGIYKDGHDRWAEFYEKYPKSPGYIRLSRVGFNRSIDRALVYAGNQKGRLNGAGGYFLLVKKNGVWKIEQESHRWAS
jgi:hypothetical protein